MTTISWPELRALTITTFAGQTPRAEDEQTIIDVFATQPSLILAAITEVTQSFAEGKVRYPWAILAKRIETSSRPLSLISVETSPDKDKRIAAAERWIHNAGVHYDLERDVEEELFPTLGGGFDDRGALSAWADDHALRARLIERWRNERPRGERAEAAALAYQQEAGRYWLQTHTPQRAAAVSESLLALTTPLAEHVLAAYEEHLTAAAEAGTIPAEPVVVRPEPATPPPLY